MDNMPLESHQGNILNYSIISSEEEENPLILKLKVSSKNKNKIPIVRLEKLEINKIRTSMKPKKVNKDLPKNEPESSPKKRKSNKEQKIDASPKKIQRLQRTAKTKSKSDDIDNLESLCKSIRDKVQIKTPIKRTLTKYVNDDSNDVSPTKRGSVNKNPIESTPTRRASRQLNIKLSPMAIDENQSKIRSCEASPQKSVKVNLNESFRRTVLRSRNNDENIKKDSNENNNKRCTRKSKQFYYFDDNDDDDEEAVEMAEALRRSKIEVSSRRRVLRSRSNSTASNYSAATSSEDESIPEVNKRITRSRKLSEISPNSDALSPERPQNKSKVPKNKRQTNTPLTPKTPKNRLKMLRDGVITPSMQSRSSKILSDSTPLLKARSQLHVSYVPTSLPCREKEYLDVYNFLKSKLEDGCGGCMYISGVPGTGKTATVTSVIADLNKKNQFNYVSINGMRLTEPRQAYVEIWKQMTGKTVPWEQAQSLLEQRFTKKNKQTPVVMLIDELDILCTKRQDVVYNLLDWPTKSKDQLIVITIANTMDLPERLLMSRVTSRLGLTRLTFQAYTHKQLMEIITKRLSGTDSFNSDAVQLVARKVASVSGDARRALDICRRAAEIAEGQSSGQVVNIMHINEALTAMITQPQVMAIKRCSRLQKLILQAIVAEIERTGVEETTFVDVYKMLVSCCALDGFKMVSSTVAQRALYQLSASKLILTDQKCGDIYQKVILNVSVHDVYFALKKD